MRLLDKRFGENKAQYVLQCLLATVSILLIQLVIGAFAHIVVVAAFGASAFIAFTMPHAEVSKARFLIGGYLVGLVIGTAGNEIAALLRPGDVSQWAQLARVTVACASVGVTMLVMVVTDTEHPPAAGLALGIALESQWDLLTAATLLGGIVTVVLLKRLLKPILKNLM